MLTLSPFSLLPPDWLVVVAPALLCLFSSLLARIFRLRGCRSTTFCGVSFTDEVDDADGLGAFEGVSASVLATLALPVGLTELLLPVLVVFVVLVVGFTAVSMVVSLLDDVAVVDVLVLVLVVVAELVVDTAGAGDGDVLCNCCGDELFEPRSTDWPPRWERNTRCCRCSSLVNVPLAFLSSTLFVDSTEHKRKYLESYKGSIQ